MDLSFLVSKEAILFGQCGQRKLAEAGLADTLDLWISEGSDLSFQQLQTAFRDSVLFVLIAAPHDRQLNLGPNEKLLCICGREVLADVTEGGLILPANTSCSLVEAWSAHDPRFARLAVDAPALARAATVAGVELGFTIGEGNALALSPKNSRRNGPAETSVLTTSDMGGWLQRLAGPSGQRSWRAIIRQPARLPK